jgi:hypothetical protein
LADLIGVEVEHFQEWVRVWVEVLEQALEVVREQECLIQELALEVELVDY